MAYVQFGMGRPYGFAVASLFTALAWFVASFPQQALDGALWISRSSFEQLSVIVRKEVPVDAEWRQVRYMIFELPVAFGALRQCLDQIRKFVR